MARLFIPACLLAAIVGCRAFYPTPAPEEPTESAPVPTSNVVPVSASFESTSESPEPTTKRGQAPEPIALALECLDKGDHSQAVLHLKRHVDRNPDQVLFRAQLAELLVHIDRLPEAQSEYELVISATQENPAAARERLVHYHTRLMEVARERRDEYAEFLHRGIGLHLVACQLASKGNAEDFERLECKAAASLREAHELRPDDARASWYLYRVWTELDQPRPAAKSLNRAIANAPFSMLTPVESRELTLASQQGTILK